MTTDGGSTWKIMPREVLVHIFRYYIEMEGQNRLLNVISRVCQEWKNICFDRDLWRTFDGTLPRRYLFMLSKQGSLGLIEKLILTGEQEADQKLQFAEEDETEKYTKESNKKRKTEKFSDVFSNMPNLKHIIFLQFINLEREILLCLLDLCPHVSEIEFSGCDENEPYQSCIFEEKFSAILKSHGSNLTSINFSNTSACDLTPLLGEICLYCPNLLQFCVSSIRCLSSYFPIACFQNNCQKLKVLSLDSGIFFSEEDKGFPGFPDLEKFTYFGHTYNRNSLDNDELIGILHHSNKLKLLDIRCNPHITNEYLNLLPAEGIEYLYISATLAAFSPHLHETLAKWSHTLKIVDISWCNLELTDEAAISLTTCLGKSNLKKLNLSKTNVSPPVIKKLIEYCSNLQILNLTQCRNFPNDLQREYCSKNEIQHLYTILCGEGHAL